MLDARDWYLEKKIQKTLDSLRKKGFEVFPADSGGEAVKQILQLIPDGSLVGLGGSVTLRELNLPEILREQAYKVADHWKARSEGASTEEVMEIRRKHINSDVFITSSNAVTVNGELVNIDGGGQRVASMIFGPKRVFVVVGINKLTRDLDEAIWRVKNVAAPMNAKRLNKHTPCTISGVCEDCDSDERICRAMTILNRKPSTTPVTVILVKEELGY
ncbi:MAG: lactate utilization protein [Candidatus Bathyarchaeia archaeon]